jgi:hypothetical protein
VGVVIHPKLAASDERNGCCPSTQVLAVLGDQQILAVEQKSIDVINDPGCPVVRIRTRLPVTPLYGDTNTVEVLGQLTEGSFSPLSRHTRSPTGWR